MKSITSPSNPTFRRALKLHESRGRKQQNRVIIFGRNEIRRALDAGVEVAEIFISEKQPLDESLNQLLAANELEDSVFVLTEQLFGKLCFGNRHEEMILVAVRPETELQRFQSSKDSMVVVLESIEKPGNVGAVFRSAVAAGVDAIILADPLTDAFHPNAIRSSLGAVFAVPVFSGASEEVKSLLRDQQFKIVAAKVDAGQEYTAKNLKGSVALVVGNEHNGLSEVWSGENVTAVTIPMRSEIDSLNVAQSATLLVYESHRQRAKKNAAVNKNE